MIVGGFALGTILIGRLAVAQGANNLLVTGMQYQQSGEDSTVKAGLHIIWDLSLVTSWHQHNMSGNVHYSDHCMHLLVRSLIFGYMALSILQCGLAWHALGSRFHYNTSSEFIALRLSMLTDSRHKMTA